MMMTRCVSGRTKAIFCTHPGMADIGKNTPLKRNIGVMKRKNGKLNCSIWRTNPVQIMPIDAKRSPAIKETGIIQSAEGCFSKPKNETKIIIRQLAITALVAPQRSSPVTTSSTKSGVARMASKVFW